MAGKTAKRQKESAKNHGDPLEAGGPDSGARTTTPATASKPATQAGRIPAPENGGHERSHAAHLGGAAHEHTKPADMLKKGVESSALREPPMVVQRVGKQHR